MQEQTVQLLAYGAFCTSGHRCSRAEPAPSSGTASRARSARRARRNACPEDRALATPHGAFTGASIPALQAATSATPSWTRLADPLRRWRPCARREEHEAPPAANPLGKMPQRAPETLNERPESRLASQRPAFHRRTKAFRW